MEPTLGELLARCEHGVRDFSCLSDAERRAFLRGAKDLHTAEEVRCCLQKAKTDDQNG